MMVRMPAFLPWGNAAVQHLLYEVNGSTQGINGFDCKKM